jgi:hypothetical protein
MESYGMLVESCERFGVTNRTLQLQQKSKLEGTSIAVVKQAHLIILEQSVDFLGGGR